MISDQSTEEVTETPVTPSAGDVPGQSVSSCRTTSCGVQTAPDPTPEEIAAECAAIRADWDIRKRWASRSGGPSADETDQRDGFTWPEGIWSKGRMEVNDGDHE